MAQNRIMVVTGFVMLNRRISALKRSGIQNTNIRGQVFKIQI